MSKKGEKNKRKRMKRKEKKFTRETSLWQAERRSMCSGFWNF